MSDPIVSVVMITHNHREYISQAIECVLRQETNFPFELVIGEDCSTDGTRDIVFDYHRRYPAIVRVVTSERNVGMNANVLRTERACRGKYIAYCEGDDYWHNPHKLQMQVDYLEHNPHYGMVHSDADIEYVAHNHVIRASHRTTGTVHTDGDNQFFRILEGRFGSIFTCTVCARRDLVDAIVSQNPELGDDRFRMGDTPRWLELSRVTVIGYIDKSLATHRVLVESAAHSKDTQKKRAFIESVREMREHYCTKYNVPEPTRRLALVSCYNRLLRLAFVSGDQTIAIYAKRGLNSLSRSLTLSQVALYYSVRYRLLRLITRAFCGMNGIVSRHPRLHHYLATRGLCD